MDKGIIDTYNRESDKLIEQYESKTFEQVHQFAVPFLPMHPSIILEVGAGSGRDASWFASHGHQIVAVEPAGDLRKKAQTLHPSPSITWVDDSLPELKNTLGLDQEFDLIWLSAVWMHLPPENRAIAFTNLASMLLPKGRIMVTLRHGTPPEGRKVYQVSADELMGFALKNGLVELCIQRAEDTFNRDEVWWQTVVLGKAD